MSINQPFLYIFLIIMLHNLHYQHTGLPYYQANAASIGIDYMDVIDKGLNYEPENIDIADSTDIEQQDVNYIPERVLYKSTQDNAREVTEMPLVRRAYNEPEEEGSRPLRRSACGPPEPTNNCNRQEEINAALKDTQDTIEKVSNLIKDMRRHAVALIKNINELETDLLASCDDDKTQTDNCATPEPDCNTNNNNGYGNNDNRNNDCGNYGNNSNGNNGQSGNNGNSDNNCNNDNGNGNGNNNDSGNGNDNNGNGYGYGNGNENGNSNGNSCGLNGDTGYSSGAPQIPMLVPTPIPLVMNEWSATVKNDVEQTQSSKDFMAEAQDAVRSWKTQIEACKQLLDSAIAQAAHGSLRNQSPTYVYKPRQQANDQQGPQHQGSQLQQVQMAPAAAASLTPVVAQHPQLSGNASIASPKETKPTLLRGKTNDILNKLKKVKSDSRKRTFNGKYDHLRAEGSPAGWNLF